MYEAEIVKLACDQGIRSYLKRKYPAVYADYEPYIPEWIIDAVGRYDPTLQTKLSNYVLRQLEYRMLRAYRDDPQRKLRATTMPSHIIEQVAISTPNFDRDRRLVEILDQYIAQRQGTGRKTSVRAVLADYLGIGTERLSTKDICSKYGISREYIRQVKVGFTNWVSRHRMEI